MKKALLEWLKTYYNAKNVNDVQKAISDELGLSFLIVWSIFESRVCMGFVKKQNIPDLVEMLYNHYEDLEIEHIIKHFHDRYQDNTNYRHLKNGQRCKESDDIISKEYSTLKNKEKIYLIIYIVYRYRNNIFHGSKGYDSWCEYKEQIEYCVECMMKIYDCSIKYNIMLEQC